MTDWDSFVEHTQETDARTGEPIPEPEPCRTCGGNGCEYGCGRCTSANIGPDSHRICRSCGGSGRS